MTKKQDEKNQEKTVEKPNKKEGLVERIGGVAPPNPDAPGSD